MGRCGSVVLRLSEKVVFRKEFSIPIKFPAMKRFSYLKTTFLVLFFTSLCLVSCRRVRKETDPSPAFFSYIKAYTGGMITESSTVRIELAFDLPELSAEQESGLFEFSPRLKGQTRKISDRVIEFVPQEGQLKAGKTYRGTFFLKKLIRVDDADLGKFVFSFHVAIKEASMQVHTVRIGSGNSDSASVEGILSLSQKAGQEQVSLMVSARYGGQKIPVRVQATENPLSYSFSTAAVARSEKDQELVLSLDGEAAGFKALQEEKAVIPARGRFSLLRARCFELRDPYVEIQFSDPLSDRFDPEGLLVLSPVGRQYFRIEDNIVRIYYERSSSDGDLSLFVSANLKNDRGQRLGQDFQTVFKPQSVKPAVEIPFKGTILPDARQLILPFRSVNLRAVDVRVVRVYADNILMFLQDNDLSGTSQLRRSGRLVYSKTLDLAALTQKDLHQWQDFSIDLSGMFEQEPGALYSIRFSFKQEYSLYGKTFSGSESGQGMLELSDGKPTEEEEAVWDEPSSYYYDDFYDWEQYRWSDRNDPLTPSYYMESERMPSCNLIASSIGMIAKSGSEPVFWVAVNDILTTEPLAGVQVTAYDFQLRDIGHAVSDKQGMAELRVKGRPFVLKASSPQGTAYLKTDPGSQKSMSRFDVSGKRREKGLKAYIYGERGVWRPGDTLHLTVIVENSGNGIPFSHPATLEIYTPRGQFYRKMMGNGSQDGFYVFHLPTRSDDPTGTWNAYFKLGGAAFHKSLRIESVKPNRIRIDLDMGVKTLRSGSTVPLRLQARWLTGPAAAGLKAKVGMTLSKRNTIFKGYEKYVFTDPASAFVSSTQTLLEQRLDAEGSVAADVKMPQAENAPGMLQANLIAQVDEAGGDASVMTWTLPFSPYDAYVGILLPETENGYLETDKDHSFDVVSLSSDGRLLSGRRLEYGIYRLDWSWWWESRNESLENYVNGTSAKPYLSGELHTRSGKARIPFRLDYPQWGRYLVYVKDVESGHASGGIIYVDWPSWRGRSAKTDPDGLAMLSFSTDKKSYRVGETATVYIPSAAGGRALVSFENGSRVLERHWVKTDTVQDKAYTFEIKPEMAPNFYIHISLLQPHASQANDLPIRMYGVQPVSVENPTSHLEPRITMPESLRPLEPFTIRISERQNRPMTYTLAIVDEGLLDLTSFRTPDPWSEMYTKEALGVMTWDMYDEVIGSFGGRMSPLFSIGGDEALQRTSKRDNRFNPVVKFIGPFTLKKGQNKHTLTLPMYVGSVRVMVVAGHEGAYGNAEKTVPVRTPLMLLSSLPRMLGTGETLNLPVNVFAMEENIGKVSVKVETEGPLYCGQQTSGDLTFDRPGDKMLRFALHTTDKEGWAKVRITASSGHYTAREEISIMVRNPTPALLETRRVLLSPGQGHRFEYAPFKSTERQWARLEIAGFPSVDIHGCFDFMDNYAHYCTEQLSSKGLTLLYLMDLASEKQASRARQMIPEILQQLYARQLPDGGFSYWPGNAHADEWAGTMAGHFMTQAKIQGFDVNQGVWQAWKRFEQNAARQYRSSDAGHRMYDQMVQAYRLYALALASEPLTGAMNRMKEDPELCPQAVWRLAAAYALSGKKAVARQMVGSLPLQVSEYTPFNLTYGSSLRDRAMILETLVLTDDLERALDMAARFASDFSSSPYPTTQNTAFASVAFGTLARRVDAAPLSLSISEGGKTAEKIQKAQAFYTYELDPQSGNAEIRNLSEAVVYAALLTRRQPEYGRKVEAFSSGISVSVRYFDSQGQEISPERLPQGTDFEAAITVADVGMTTHYTNLALTYAVPSGWEIFNARLFDADAYGQNPEACDYTDIRDDKVIYYFDLPQGFRKTFRIRLQASYEGDFVLPSTYCEAMYEPSVYGRTASSRVKVVP